MSFENYKRFPIQLSDHCIMLIHLFKREDKLEDMWTWDNEYMNEESYTQYQLAAKQLMQQLEGEYTPLFLEALEKEIQERKK